MEPKVPIKEKISKFWNKKKKKNDLGILGAAAGGLIGGFIKATGLTGRQKATYDVSLSTQYFCNQNKPEFIPAGESKNIKLNESRKLETSKKIVSNVKGKFNEILEKYSSIPNGFSLGLINNESDFSLIIKFKGKMVCSYNIMFNGEKNEE